MGYLCSHYVPLDFPPGARLTIPPLGILRFRPTGLPGQSVQQCETRRGFTLPFWEGAGSVRRRTSENAACAPESLEHVLRKVKQLKRLAPSLLSCFLWTRARGGRNTNFGCAVHPAREVSMMRLQACQCHPMNCLDRTGSTSTLRSSCSALPQVSTGSSLCRR